MNARYTTMTTLLASLSLSPLRRASPRLPALHWRPPMRRVVSLAIVLAPVLGLADAPAPPRRPAPRPPLTTCLGRWRGLGRGESGSPWSIDMVVTAERGARCGTIEYPSLRCGGYLVNCHRDGDTVTWTEVYTHNPGTCAPAGVVVGRCEGATMGWTWTGMEVVRTVLRRAE